MKCVCVLSEQTHVVHERFATKGGGSKKKKKGKRGQTTRLIMGMKMTRQKGLFIRDGGGDDSGSVFYDRQAGRKVRMENRRSQNKKRALDEAG